MKNIYEVAQALQVRRIQGVFVCMEDRGRSQTEAAKKTQIDEPQKFPKGSTLSIALISLTELGIVNPKALLQLFGSYVFRLLLVRFPSFSLLHIFCMSELGTPLFALQMLWNHVPIAN